MKGKHTIHKRTFKLRRLISSVALRVREILLQRADNGNLTWYRASAILICLLFLNAMAIAQTVSRESISRNVEEIIKSARGSDGKQEQQHISPIRQVRLSKTKNGHLRILGAPPSQHFPVSSVVPGDAQATAKNFLTEHKTAFGMTRRGFDLVARRTKTKGRRSHVRFGQTYAGISVFATETVVQLNEEGGVEYVSSDIVTDLDPFYVEDVLTTPSITGLEAEQIAIDMLTQEHPECYFQAEPAKLMIYEPSIVGNIGPTCLIWHTKIASTPEPVVAELVLVDAHSGDIALHYPLVRSALNRKIYTVDCSLNIDSCSLQRQEGEPPCQIVPDVDLAYDYLKDVYDFYRDHHGRDGVDNAGMIPQVYVGHCSDAENPLFKAFWHSEGYMVFEEGIVVDDAVGHEWTHGVTQFESGLIYVNESGAIDESFCDMWGEWIDQTNGRGNDGNEVKWLIGEDLLEHGWSFEDGRTALRNMKNPSEKPYENPDRKGSRLWDLDPENVDNGGVHTNSGVNNKLCYLLTDGDNFNGFTIWGMGIDKVAELYYEVQTNLLTMAANYNDLYFALIQAAINLEWTDDEKQNLEHACQAVEISDHSNKFYSSDVPKEIRSLETTSSTLVINETGFIIDLNVEIDIYHTWNEDLDVYLISPDGTAVELFTDVGGDSTLFLGTILDDESPISITSGSGPFNGSYSPEGNLSDLIGRSITGTWTLEVTDDYERDEGELLSWALFIEILSSDEIDIVKPGHEALECHSVAVIHVPYVIR
jgi:Zn-dependent metalloprotease/subtilisin-like proprotein convertase family protein